VEKCSDNTLRFTLLHTVSCFWTCWQLKRRPSCQLRSCSWCRAENWAGFEHLWWSIPCRWLSSQRPPSSLLLLCVLKLPLYLRYRSELVSGVLCSKVQYVTEWVTPVETYLNLSTGSRPVWVGETGVVDGRCSVAGELKLTGQRLLTTHVYAFICEHLGLVLTHTHAHTVLCGYMLNTGPTVGLSSWWSRNRWSLDSQIQQRRNVWSQLPHPHD